MMGKCVLYGSIVVLSIGLAACAEMSRLDTDHGTSAKLVKYNQILNPEAGKNLDPVTGLSGQAADKVMHKYIKGFEKPSPAPAYNLTIGTIGK